MTYSDDRIHRILLELRFLHTVQQTCAKWEVSAYQLRKWKKQRPGWRWTLEDLIIAAIHTGGWHAPADLIGWLDYQNHAVYSASEVRELFDTLEARGEVRRDGERFQYVQLEAPFVFGPRLLD